MIKTLDFWYNPRSFLRYYFNKVNENAGFRE